STAGDLSLIAAAGLWLVWRGWRKWTHPIIDFGRELYVPWQIVEGKSLYSDLAYFNGPLSPHLNALVFRFFGTTLTTILIVNLLITTATTLLIYCLVRKLGGRLAGVTASLLFLVVFATADLIGFGNYNFLTPYSHEMTHGTFLCLGLLWVVGRTFERPSKARLMLCGLALGLIFLTKAEFFIASVVAALLGFGIDKRLRHQPWSQSIRSLYFVLAGALVAPIIAWLALWIRVGARDATIGVLGTWPYLLLGELSKLPFYRQGMGLDDPMASLVKMSTWLAIYCLALGPGCLVRPHRLSTSVTAGGRRRRTPHPCHAAAGRRVRANALQAANADLSANLRAGATGEDGTSSTLSTLWVRACTPGYAGIGACRVVPRAGDNSPPRRLRHCFPLGRPALSCRGRCGLLHAVRGGLPWQDSALR
ncbi:MAG: glycosyltransferase family 39 protein, partial [Acidobacteriota bacterium]